MVKLRGKFDAGNLLLVVILAIIGLYLWSQFTVDGTLVLPTAAAASGAGLWVLKFIIIGLLVIVAVNLVTKISVSTLGKRDVFTMIMLIAIVYFAYTYVFAPILGAATLDSISFGTGVKLGLYP